MTSRQVREYVSFYLENPVTYQPNLILQGGATTRDGKFVATHKSLCWASPSYYPCPHLKQRRNNQNGKLFFTSFSFTIHARDENNTADGLAFFLAPINNEPKSGGGYLGIFTEGVESEQVVAVEFDTCRNKQDGIKDPEKFHIGIDVNSIKSTDYTPWIFENHQEAIAYISYDGTASSKRILKATLVYPKSEKHYTVESSKGVDLVNALPEWVRVGFSAFSGRGDSHDVGSWYFASSFGDDPATLVEPLKKENPSLAKYLDLHFESGK